MRRVSVRDKFFARDAVPTANSRKDAICSIYPSLPPDASYNNQDDRNVFA